MAIGPVEQIFLQAGAGMSGGASFHDATVSGFQLGQNARRLNLEERQQNALLPLMQKANELSNEETSLDIQLKMLNKEQAVQVKRAQSQAGQLMLEASKSPDGFANQEIFGRTSELFKQNPALWGTDIGKSLLNQVQAAMMVQQSQQAIEKARSGGLEQSSQTIKTPTGTVTLEAPKKADPLDETRLNLEKRRLDLVEKELGVREKAAQARNRGITKEEFILKNAPDLLKSSELLTPEEVSKQLGDIYDSVAVDPFGLFD